jgi:alkylated DNA repair dioxygenase AlkB
VVFLQPLFDTLRTKMKSAARSTFSTRCAPGITAASEQTPPFDRPLQAIITSYPSGAYNIGWHSDKMDSIAPDSIIFDVSLSAKHTFVPASRQGQPPARRSASG